MDIKKNSWNSGFMIQLSKEQKKIIILNEKYDFQQGVKKKFFEDKKNSRAKKNLSLLSGVSKKNVSLKKKINFDRFL